MATTFEDYLDKRTFCAELGISPRTADRWAVLRIGPPRTRAVKKVLYRKSAIVEWLKRQESGGAEQGGGACDPARRPARGGRLSASVPVVAVAGSGKARG